MPKRNTWRQFHFASRTGTILTEAQTIHVQGFVKALLSIFPRSHWWNLNREYENQECKKPGTWKASMRITSNLIWRTDAWFPELKTHLQVLICSVQHTICSTWSAHWTVPFFEYKPDCLDEHPNNMKTNNKKGSTSLIDTFYWINAWTKQSSSLQLKKSWT